MDAFEKWLDSSPLLNFISLFLSVAGFIFPVCFPRRNERSLKLAYIVRTINLTLKSIAMVAAAELKYSDRRIKNLVEAKVILWNDGKETINQTDIAKGDPLKIVILNDFEILSAEILFQKNKGNGFMITISEDKKSILLQFDYFDFEEGIILKIHHTGNFSKDLRVVGSVKGVKKIARKRYEDIYFPTVFVKTFGGRIKFKERGRRLALGWTMIAIGAAISLIPLLINELSDFIPRRISTAGKKLLLLFMGCFFLQLGYRLLKHRIPKGFNGFDEGF